jgi:hypothetical protein
LLLKEILIFVPVKSNSKCYFFITVHYYFLGRSVGGGGVVVRKKKEVGTKIAFISLLS